MTGTAVHYAVNREGHYKEIPKQARNETCPLSQQRHVRWDGAGRTRRNGWKIKRLLPVSGGRVACGGPGLGAEASCEFYTLVENSKFSNDHVRGNKW